MDKAIDVAINKLIKGQEKMGIDISDLKLGQAEIKTDITDLKTGQAEMRTDISDLKTGQAEMKTDISDLKTGQAEMRTDISDLKVSQQQFEGLLHRVLDGMARIERVVVNIENDLRPKVHILLDADKIRQDDTAELKQVCREQEKQLNDHELRISRLEEQ